MWTITIGTGPHLASTSLFAMELEEEQLCNYYLHALPPSDFCQYPPGASAIFCACTHLKNLSTFGGALLLQEQVQVRRQEALFLSYMMHIYCVCIDCYWLLFILLSNGLCALGNGAMVPCHTPVDSVQHRIPISFGCDPLSQSYTCPKPCNCK